MNIMIKIILIILIFCNSSCVIQNKLDRFIPIYSKYNSKKLKFGKDISFFILDSNYNIKFKDFEYAYNGIFLPKSFKFSEINYFGFNLKNNLKLKNFLLIFIVSYKGCLHKHTLEIDEISNEEFNELIQNSEFELSKTKILKLEETFIQCIFNSPGKNIDGQVSNAFYCSFDFDYILMENL